METTTSKQCIDIEKAFRQAGVYVDDDVVIRMMEAAAYAGHSAMDFVAAMAQSDSGVSVTGQAGSPSWVLKNE